MSYLKESSLSQQCADWVFMALCLWREARGEPIEVKRGVCYVIMNRALNPKWWGYDIMSVLFKELQFSPLTNPKDKQLCIWPLSADNSWRECLIIANSIYNGNSVNPVGEANHFYDVSISPPYWADKDKFVVQLGKIKFYAL